MTENVPRLIGAAQEAARALNENGKQVGHMKVTVVIPTHNPKLDFLERALDALKIQTLPLGEWELIIIDNASRTAVDGLIDVSWHPRSRVVREMELGLTPARCRGIREAKSELIVFVDDDAVLKRDYLAQAIGIGERFGFLGVWAGRCLPWFEEQPADWVRPFWCYLTIRDFSETKWSNLGLDYPDGIPWGAGLCVRRSVALVYLGESSTDPLLKALDRKGTALTGGGDVDLSLIAVKMGLGMGLFPELELTHLIRKERVQEPYLLRLVEGATYSSQILAKRHNREIKGALITWWRRPLGVVRRFLTHSPRKRRFYEAVIRGEQRALREFALLDAPAEKHAGSPPEASPQP